MLTRDRNDEEWEHPRVPVYVRHAVKLKSHFVVRVGPRLVRLVAMVQNDSGPTRRLCPEMRERLCQLGVSSASGLRSRNE